MPNEKTDTLSEIERKVDAILALLENRSDHPKCATCKGRGSIIDPFDTRGQRWITCAACNGKGF